MPTSLTFGNGSERDFPNIYEIFEDVPFSVAVLRGPDLVIEYINHANLTIWQSSREEVMGKPLYEAKPELRRDTEPIHRKIYETGQRFQAHEVPIEIVGDNETHLHYFQVSIDPIRNKEGQIIGQIATSIDVTEQVQFRQKLQKSEQHLELLRNAVPAMIFYLDQEERYQTYNDTFCKWFGVGKKEAIGQTVREFIGEAAYTVVSPHLKKAYGGEVEQYEINAPSRYDGKRWLNIVYTPDKNEAGEVRGIIVLATDVTESKMADMARQNLLEANERASIAIESGAYLQQIINVFSAPLQVLQPVIENGLVTDFVYKLTNTAYAAHTAFTPEELVGKKVSEIFPGYFETDSFKNICQVAITGVANTWENHYAADGLDIFNLMSAAIMTGDVVVHMTDFTRLKSLQLELQRKVNELERSNKSLEEFAHAASHDLKEPIRKIQYFTDQLNSELGKQLDEKQSRLFQRVENATQRMASLIDDLLQYSHVSQRPLKTEVVNLNETIQWVKDDLELVITQKGAQLQVDDLPVIKGYKRQMQQLFQNLVSNAIKYSKENIPAIIKIHSKVVNGGEVDMEMEKMYHCISVEDNGIGFQQEYGEQIFQMFQRLHAKVEYSGTGVGLSIARRIVENHHGKILATGIPEVGATFYVYLPVS